MPGRRPHVGDAEPLLLLEARRIAAALQREALSPPEAVEAFVRAVVESRRLAAPTSRAVSDVAGLIANDASLGERFHRFFQAAAKRPQSLQ